MPLEELIILVPCHSLEDFPTELGDEPAAGLLNAFAVVFHPELIAAAESFPRYRRADEAGEAKPGQLYILPTACNDWVPHGWAEDARRAGSHVVSGLTQRDDLLNAALQAIPPEQRHDCDPEIVRDFLALGTIYLQTELLTRHMRNYSHLEEDQMLRELLAGARVAFAGDADAARAHLRRCFEMLLSCRERFYPVECSLIDLCLVIPRLANDDFGKLLESDTPVNFLAQARDWEEILAAHPEWQEAIQVAWANDRIELVGGDWTDRPAPLMSLDSQIAELQRGQTWYQQTFGRTPIVWGKRRFGVGPHLPQLLHRLGYTGALHFVMDDGVYPDEEQANMRWQGSDGSPIEAYSRIPLAGDSASSWLRFPVRMSESMDYDHVVGVVFARWPEMRTPWMEDFHRAQRYAPVLGKFTTWHEFFSATDTHGAINEFAAGRYLTPFLVQSVARREADPVSRYVRYWETQRRFLRVDWARRLSELLSQANYALATDTAFEDALWAADPEADADTHQALASAMDSAEAAAHANVARLLTGSEAGSGDGVLVVNPHSFARHVLVDWPAGTAPSTKSELKHIQVTEDSAAAIVDLPGCGFHWLPAVPRGGVSNSSVGKLPMAEDLVLRTDLFEVELSNMTGGIAQIRTYRRSPNRLSQQIALRYPHERTAKVLEGDE
ncbi:MAG: hypothetical protein KDA58_12735, partial [Planctomycetaceae bacterium]|nr:hypothetical protein [Planctomycetaceae bacterium]